MTSGGWEPILEGSEADAAWAAVREIADAITGPHLPLVPRVIGSPTHQSRRPT